MKTPPNRRQALMAVYLCAGSAVLLVKFAEANTLRLSNFFYYLVCANIAAVGLRLTKHRSTPAGFLVLLLAIEDLSLPELLFIALTVTLLTELPETGSRVPRLASMIRSIASVSIGVTAAQTIYHATSAWPYNALFPAPMIASSLVLLLNWGLARALSQYETAPFRFIRDHEIRPLLPWFVGTAYLASLIRNTSLLSGMHAGLVALPVLFVFDAGFRTWFNANAQHKEELAAQHERTLETLAVAIDARIDNSGMHVWRLQRYVRAVGEELNLDEEQLEHLNVAALLHDVGKLGIPDHILLKPGSLSPEEWEKMKAHPVTGAEMLRRMRYPAPVLAIVAAHHEKWDGTGYPRGLKGEQIPIGARILAAVDCLDALASERSYRPAMPIDEAMAMVAREKRKSFDPRVVAVLERRYQELERLAWGEVSAQGAQASSERAASPNQDLRGLAAMLHAESQASPGSMMDPIFSARQETQLLQALARELTHALGVNEVAQAIHESVKQKTGHDTLAIYVSYGDQLEPMCVVGENSHLFSKEAFPIRKSLSGRVIEHDSSILNGDPCMESSFKNDSTVVYKLQSALAVPLTGPKGMAGVLTLYHADRNAFSRDDLGFLQAVSCQVAPAIESALRFHDTEKLAVTDHLTGVPNARSFALHLEKELARASRDNTTVGVLVCDLNGFKLVNDRFGHLKGNEVLKAVAQGLQDVCRKFDYVARIGGDEFVIIVPGLQEELRWSYVERLQGVVRAAGWNVCDEQCISMSVGVAIYPLDGADAETLVAEADRRMYIGKKQTSSLLVAPKPS